MQQSATIDRLGESSDCSTIEIAKLFFIAALFSEEAMWTTSFYDEMYHKPQMSKRKKKIK